MASERTPTFRKGETPIARTATPTGGDWRHHAVCRDEPPELFFPVGTSGPALLQVAAAKAVCHSCPVAGDCLHWALTTGQADGVWGGMSEEERRAFKRRGGRVRLHTRAF